MNEEWKGICHGGPKHGEELTSDTPTVQFVTGWAVESMGSTDAHIPERVLGVYRWDPERAGFVWEAAQAKTE